MALPFLPAEHIVPMFDQLSEKLHAVLDQRLDSLYNYLRTTWLDSSIHGHETVRTDNDVEGNRSFISYCIRKRYSLYCCQKYVVAIK